MLFGTHPGDFVLHFLRNEEKLCIRLAQAKNMTLTGPGHAEYDEQRPRIPFVLQVANHRHGDRAGVVREKTRVRFRADHVAERRHDVQPRVKQIELGIFYGRKEHELAPLQTSPRLLHKVPLKSGKPIVIDDMALVLVGILQFETIRRAFNKREAMQRLDRRPVLHFHGIASPAGGRETNRLERQIVIFGMNFNDHRLRTPWGEKGSFLLRSGVFMTPQLL